MLNKIYNSNISREIWQPDIFTSHNYSHFQLDFYESIFICI